MYRGKVLIDGDILAYRSAYSAKDETSEWAEAKVDELIWKILDDCVDLGFPVTGDYQVYLTGRTNFRFKIAKGAVYKGNRKPDKPEFLPAARRRMITEWGAIVSEDEEADDLIGKACTELKHDCVIASIDKDMLQLPCWHYNISRADFTKVSRFEGHLFFYTQILTGDAADNIKGLAGVGPKTAEKLMQGVETEQDMWEVVLKAYNNNTELITENARLLWLRRFDNQMWSIPVF